MCIIPTSQDRNTLQRFLNYFEETQIELLIILPEFGFVAIALWILVYRYLLV